MAAVAAASTAKIYWRALLLMGTRVYAVGDYEDSCWRARELDNAKHVFFEGGNDNPTKATFEDPNNPGRMLNFYPREGGYDLFVQDGDGNKIGDCWKDNLDECDSNDDPWWASGWGQCNYS